MVTKADSEINDMKQIIKSIVNDMDVLSIQIAIAFHNIPLPSSDRGNKALFLSYINKKVIYFSKKHTTKNLIYKEAHEMGISLFIVDSKTDMILDFLTQIEENITLPLEEQVEYVTDPSKYDKFPEQDAFVPETKGTDKEEPKPIKKAKINKKKVIVIEKECVSKMKKEVMEGHVEKLVEKWNLDCEKRREEYNEKIILLREETEARIDNMILKLWLEKITNNEFKNYV